MSKCFIKNAVLGVTTIIETNSIPGKIYGNFGMVQFAERNQVPPPLLNLGAYWKSSLRYLQTTLIMGWGELVSQFMWGLVGEKIPKFFPTGSFVCCSWNVSQSSLISRTLLCSEKLLGTCLVDHLGWLTKKTFGHSLFQWFHTLKSLYFKAYFSFTLHLESPYTDLNQFKHKSTYLFATNLKKKQYTRQEQSWKNIVINS